MSDTVGIMCERRHRSLALSMLACLLLAVDPCALGLDPSLDISQYAHTAWRIREGFTRGPIQSIAQTPDGYLWFGTASGLLRFDGVRSTPWQPPGGEQLPSNDIQSLLVARDGRLWIGTLKGLASWKDGRLTQYPEVAGVVSWFFLEDREQTVWFGTFKSAKARLCAIRQGKIECYGAGTFGNVLNPLYQDHKGNLWLNSRTGLWRWTPGHSEHFAFPRGITDVTAATEDDSGVLLLGTNDGLKRLVDRRIETYPLPGITSRVSFYSFLRSHDGRLWMGTSQGLLHMHQGRIDPFSPADGLSGDSVTRIFEDREGDIWVATLEGLDRFRDYAIPTVSRNQGLLNSVVWSVQAASDDGSVWIGTSDGFNRWADGQVTAYRIRGSPRALGLDDEGRLWASTSDGDSYFQRGKFIRATGIPRGSTNSIAGDGHAGVWILRSQQLIYWSPKAVQQIPWSQLGQKAGRAMLPDRKTGGVWLGFWEGGVVYLKDRKVVRSYDGADGLGAGPVTHLRFGPNGGLWASTEGGLSRIKNEHVQTLTSKNGLPCDTVHWSIEDDDKAVWLGMPCGLVRIARLELDSWINDPKHIVRTTAFDNSDGVSSVGVYGAIGPHVTKSADGRIWFVANDGVSVIDPRHLPFNRLPPPVHVEKITADGNAYDAAQGLRLPAHVQHIDIDYTALSLVAPEKNRFRFKLEGYDRDWRDVGNRRQAFYTNLPPRNYRFRVMASNDSGVWNEAGASLDFSVAPAYYQTWWFRSLCVVAFFGLLVSAYLLRVRQMEQWFSMRMEARVAERTRIARDLHDTLLQSFHGLMFRFQAARNMLPRSPENAMRTLDEAISSTRAAITESRDAIHDLRSEPVTDGDLVQLLETVGEELTAVLGADQNSPAFRVIVEGERQKISPALHEEVYRIAREVMRNAFRHAGAKKVEVEIRYDKSQLRLRVRDDGRGLDPKALEASRRPGHWGLAGIRERAQEIGAQLAIWSEDRAGTEVELTVPDITYKDAPNKSRFRLFRKERV